MKLILTQYVDTEPEAAADKLQQAVVEGLSAAANRIAADRDDVVIEQLPDGLCVHGGLEVLDGSELRLGGVDRLTTLEIVVPWMAADHNGAKLLAANAFAHAVATEVRTAA